MTPLTEVSRVTKFTETWSMYHMVTRGWERQEWELVLKGNRVSVWEDE